MYEGVNINISRYEQYPPRNPNGYVVGFNVKVNGSDRFIYAEHLIKFVDADGKTTEEIIASCYDYVKEQIEREINIARAEKEIVTGKQFDPISKSLI